MKAEHWKCNDGELIHCIDNGPTPEWATRGQTRCCTIEGKDWNEIMKKYHEHLEWEPYEK